MKFFVISSNLVSNIIWRIWVQIFNQIHQLCLTCFFSSLLLFSYVVFFFLFLCSFIVWVLVLSLSTSNKDLGSGGYWSVLSGWGCYSLMAVFLFSDLLTNFPQIGIKSLRLCWLILIEISLLVGTVFSFYIVTSWYSFFILFNNIMVGDSDPLSKWLELEIHPLTFV